MYPLFADYAIINAAAALASFDSEDMEDLIAELEKEQAFTVEIRIRFEQTVTALQGGDTTES